MRCIDVLVAYVCVFVHSTFRNKQTTNEKVAVKTEKNVRVCVCGGGEKESANGQGKARGGGLVRWFKSSCHTGTGDRRMQQGLRRVTRRRCCSVCLGSGRLSSLGCCNGSGVVRFEVAADRETGKE